MLPLARPCNENGDFLPPGAPPPADPPLPDPSSSEPWEPFDDRSQFEYAEFAFEEAELSEEKAEKLLRIWAARNIYKGGSDEDAIFPCHKAMLETIDSIEEGDSPYTSFRVRYTGEVNDNSPSWMREEYVVHCRNALTVVENLAASTDFNGSFNYVPYEEYIGPHKRQWSNNLSGSWVWKKAVRSRTCSADLCTHEHIIHSRTTLLQNIRTLAAP